MYYTYILYSHKYNRWYIGYSANLRNRIDAHNSGSVSSTKHFKPWVLMYYEAFQTEALARDRERKLKNHGRGFSELKKRITPIDI